MYNTIYPGYVQSYYNINRQQIQKKQEEKKDADSSKSAENRSSYEPKQSRNDASGAFYFPNGEKSAVDYTKQKPGIDQILSDFRNTIAAIGTPDDVKSEASEYLGLAEKQAQKENPDKEIIQSNLKNAAKILDEYIADTLKKPSKVVSEWVNTLLLQSVDYKSIKPKEETQDALPEKQPDEITEEITEIEEAQEEEKTEKTAVPEKTAVKTAQSEIYVPSDNKLRRMFIQAKKYAAIDRNNDALRGFELAKDYAEKTGDEKTQAMIHFEEGNIYTAFSRPEEALYNYAISALMTEDNNLKARAYLSMGKIYDDNVNFEPALNHYSAAAGYAGEADNLKIQTKAFSNLANLHALRYDKGNADMFMHLAEISADETKDDKTIGIIYAKNAKMQNKLGERAKALSSYGTSAASFSRLSESESLAKDYREAALIMKSFGNAAKAKTLLNKAYSAAKNTDNAELKMLIMQDLEAV